MPAPRLLLRSTRSLMLATAAAAILCAGLHVPGASRRPGLHYPSPAGGLRWGVCRDDDSSRMDYGRGERGGATYLAGAWGGPRGDHGPGYLRFGVKVSMGWGVPAGRWSAAVAMGGWAAVAW